MEGQLPQPRQFFKVHVDGKVEPALIDRASLQAARRIAKRFADISCRELDSPTLERPRQQAERRFLDRALTRIRIGRLQIIRLLVLLGPGGAYEEEAEKKCGRTAHAIPTGGCMCCQTRRFART